MACILCVDEQPILIARMQSRKSVARSGLRQNSGSHAISSREVIAEFARVIPGWVPGHRNGVCCLRRHPKVFGRWQAPCRGGRRAQDYHEYHGHCGHTGMNNEMSRPTVLFSLTISVLHIRNFLSAVLFTHSKGKNWPPLQKNTGSLSVKPLGWLSECARGYSLLPRNQW